MQLCFTVETVVNSNSGSGAGGEWMGPGYQGATASLRSIKFSAARLPSGVQVDAVRGRWREVICCTFWHEKTKNRENSLWSSRSLSVGVAALITETQRRDFTENAQSRWWKWLGVWHEQANEGVVAGYILGKLNYLVIILKWDWMLSNCCTDLE